MKDSNVSNLIIALGPSFQALNEDVSLQESIDWLAEGDDWLAERKRVIDDSLLNNQTMSLVLSLF